MSRIRARLADEGGLTLIELVISMSVMSIIIVPLTSSFLIGLIETTSTRDRIADSSAAQVLSAYMLSDVQSSDTVAIGGSSCMPTPAVSGDTYNPKLQLQWIDPKTSEQTTVSYVAHAAAGIAQHNLLRSECSSVSATVKTSEVAGYIDSGVDGFKVTCDGLTTCTNPVKVVRVQIRAKSDAPSSQSSYTAFDFEFQARRRAG